jgi:predicted RNase H-like HicB family nuclease
MHFGPWNRGMTIPNIEGDMMLKQLTAFIERDGDGYVSLCPELDIASQGDTIEEARENLREALELFFETASHEEIQTRFHDEVYVTRLEVAVG